MYICIYINEIVVSSSIFFFGKKDFKYFIGYKDGKTIRHLCIFLPKLSAYKSDFDKTKYMYFLIKDYELLKRYNEIWTKMSSIIKK